MTEREDHLSNEVAIAAALDRDNSSIKASVRSRAISSIDRLVGAYFDVTTARLEKKAEDIRRNKGEGGELPIRTEENKIDVAIKEQELRKLTNKMKIVEAALEDLMNTTKETEDTDEPISEDWLNYFERHAEDVSSEELRKLWARVLAGEIRKPRSFSLRTLRLLSEIDIATAKSFESYVSDRINDDTILKNNDLTGADLIEAIEIEEAGLIQDVVTSTLQREYNVDDGAQCIIVDSGLIAVITVSEGTNKLCYPFVKITRVGKELCSLLVPRNPVKSLETIAQYFIDNGGATKAVIATILEQKDDQIRYAPINELKASPEAAGREQGQ